MPACMCAGVSICSNYSLADFMLRMPASVTDAASPWYDYLRRVYHAETLPLPVDLRKLEAFYPALLPVPRCTNASHLSLPSERRWHASWQRRGVKAAPGRAVCSRAECDSWLPNRPLPDADVRAFAESRAYVRVAARSAVDDRGFGHIVILQRAVASRRPGGRMMGPHRALRSKPPGAGSDGGEEWVEVSRTAFPGEGSRDYGCWFHPAVGSGVFVRRQPRAFLSFINRLAARQTIEAWTSGKEQGGFRGDGDVPRLAAERGWRGFEIVSSHGYTAGFEELGTTAPSHELVLLDEQCMHHTCPCRVKKQRMCRCALRTGCVPVATRAGWNASRACACDEHTQREVINCAGTLPTHQLQI